MGSDSMKRTVRVSITLRTNKPRSAIRSIAALAKTFAGKKEDDFDFFTEVEESP
jgi:hypothetical protein